ncbi:hypothetical protein P7C71_g479, partial [Lecanoromycetidae sp. Uapishka_2]
MATNKIAVYSLSASHVTKHTPIYNLTVRYSNNKGEEKKLELSSPFTRWFDVDGFFVAKPFQQWLASEIPVIGQVDPSNKDGSSGRKGIADGETEATAVVVEQKYETPKKSGARDSPAPSSRKGKGKKAADR